MNRYLAVLSAALAALSLAACASSAPNVLSSTAADVADAVTGMSPPAQPPSAGTQPVGNSTMQTRPGDANCPTHYYYHLGSWMCSP